VSSRRGCEFPAARGRIGLRKRAVSSAKASWGDDDHSLETSVAFSAWKEGSRHSLGVQGDGRTYGHPIVLRPVSSEDADRKRVV